MWKRGWGGGIVGRGNGLQAERGRRVRAIEINTRRQAEMCVERAGRGRREGYNGSGREGSIKTSLKTRNWQTDGECRS